MQNENLISASECCMHYDIELEFVNYLNEYGLIEITAIEQEQFIPATQLPQLEKFIHMHYELNINMEGIEAITHLLARIEKLQEEIAGLKNKLNVPSISRDSFSEFT